jgi:mRNA interferase YafQ
MNDEPLYSIFPSSKYKKTRKLAEKQGLDMDVLDWTIDQLAMDLPLPDSWKDHQLKQNMKRFRECHIGGAGDWLLVYEKQDTEMILYLVGTGSHNDLLGV